jgi:ABC-type glycerol-3-phosphate transport system substrate-binding protein
MSSGGENIVLFQHSENKEAAMEFLRFVLSKKYQEKMAEVWTNSQSGLT